MRLLPVLLAITLSGAVQAQVNPPVYDRINLSASAEREIDNDLLIATLYVQEEAARQADVADRINATMAWALDTAARTKGVKVQTTQYNTYPVYDRNQRISGWRGRQGVRLESTESRALTDLVGKLQERLAVEAISYDISPVGRTSAEEELISTALERFHERAQLVSRELGRDGYRLVEMHINTQDNRPQPMPYRAMKLEAAADMAPPVVEAGTQTVTVMINAAIELNPPR